MGSRYEKARYAREKDPFSPAQLCGACTIKDDERGGAGGAPNFYWDHLTTDTGTARLLDPKRPDSGSLFLWADGFYRHDPNDKAAKTEASGYHFINTMAARARPPARDGVMWFSVEPLVPEYLAPFVQYKVCQEVQGTCTEQMCDGCYGPALGHELTKVGDGGDSVCSGLFSGGPLEDDTGQPFDCPVRLQGGLTPNEGRVEVKHKGRWGTICSKNGGWDDTAATVLCKSLGYPRGEAVSCPDCQQLCDEPAYADEAGLPVCKYCKVPNTTTTCDNLVSHGLQLQPLWIIPTAAVS